MVVIADYLALDFLCFVLLPCEVKQVRVREGKLKFRLICLQINRNILLFFYALL